MQNTQTKGQQWQLRTALYSVLAFSALGLANPVLAGQKENAIIDKTIQAYGGSKLLSLSNLTINDKYKGFRYGQSESPDRVDMVDYHSSLTIDYKNKRKNFRWIRGTMPHFSTQHQLFDGEQGYRIRHGGKTMAQDDSITLASAGRRHSHYLDTSLVMLLHSARDKANISGTAEIDGEMHHLISFTAQGHPAMTLALNKQTGMVARMVRPHWRPDQTFVYSFSDVREQQGIKYANSTYVTRGGQPFNVSVSRSLAFNQTIDDQFVLPTGYGEEARNIDTREMSAKQLADNLYVAGSGWGFTYFLDVGDYYVAAGGYRGLKDRFAAVKAFNGKDKPLKYQMVSHHHLDHLGGMNEAAELGAQFVTVKEHVDTIRSVVEQPLADDRFILVNEKATLADGKVKTFDFANGHSTHNLITYFVDAKMIITADLFFSRQLTGAPSGSNTLKRFKEAIAQQKLQPKFYGAEHSNRVLTQADLDTAVTKISPAVCPSDWEICKT